MHNNVELYRLFLKSGMKKTDFCKKIGLQITYFNHIINQSIILRDETFNKYKKKFEQNA